MPIIRNPSGGRRGPSGPFAGHSDLPMGPEEIPRFPGSGSGLPAMVIKLPGGGNRVFFPGTGAPVFTFPRTTTGTANVPTTTRTPARTTGSAGIEKGDNEMAFDFGESLFDLGSDILRSRLVETPSPSVIRVIDPVTGEVKEVPKKRRRRRRLLTASDLADLSALSVLVGKGSDSMKVAVMKAVRRS